MDPFYTGHWTETICWPAYQQAQRVWVRLRARRSRTGCSARVRALSVVARAEKSDRLFGGGAARVRSQRTLPPTLPPTPARPLASPVSKKAALLLHRITILPEAAQCRRVPASRQMQTGCREMLHNTGEEPHADDAPGARCLPLYPASVLCQHSLILLFSCALFPWGLRCPMLRCASHSLPSPPR